MNEIERYIRNFLNSIFNQIRFKAEYAADRKLQNIINQKMNKHDNSMLQNLFVDILLTKICPKTLEQGV